MRSELVTIFQRELDGLRRQVELYPDDGSLWRSVPGCPNSGGTLALHLVGNLRHFIGTQVGKTGYVRVRPAEFSTRDLARADVVALVAEARVEVTATLTGLDAAALAGRSPLPMAGQTTPTSLWLLHLSAHLAYHLGQVDYHRRAVTGDGTSAGMLPLQPLASSEREGHG
jgi:hypothetical protein